MLAHRANGNRDGYRRTESDFARVWNPIFRIHWQIFTAVNLDQIVAGQLMERVLDLVLLKASVPEDYPELFFRDPLPLDVVGVSQDCIVDSAAYVAGHIGETGSRPIASADLSLFMRDHSSIEECLGSVG